jgi:hypothetical protein
MTEPNWLARSGATPRKLAMVGGLTVALAAVIWHNATGSAEPVAKPTRQEQPPQAEVANSQTPKPSTEKAPRHWPKLTIEGVVKDDPFAMPMWYLVAQADDAGSAGALLARSAKVLEELKKQQSKIIVISNEDRIATIGEQSFRVGDTIEGFQVTAITSEGIVLTELNR